MNNKVELSDELLQDLINIATGLFYPLKGFMSSNDYYSVLNNMTLSSGDVWTIPISLDVDVDIYNSVIIAEKVMLTHKHKKIGYIVVDDIYIVNIEEDNLKIFGTQSIKHPGVEKELAKKKYRVGGEVEVTDISLLNGSLNPKDVKNYFKSKNWKTIAGFQTRNPIHKAHEHLQRIALEICDGLFINPLVGWKKPGDFSEAAVNLGYKTMIEKYYIGLNVYFENLRTAMRYAGPREAIFHAIIRRNLGCTHFIIGRDHAGVGDYYAKYEAQKLAKAIITKNKLGIELLLLSGPFYCKKCGQIVTEKTCNHEEKYIEDISGTKIRAMLTVNKRPNDIYMRPEVADSIISLKDKKFIKG